MTNDLRNRTATLPESLDGSEELVAAPKKPREMVGAWLRRALEEGMTP